ncbi:hypothetical protein HYW21_03285 [Candidatus Woesearchaeota archaeon]|nr:hypothetical protein [Candidatus Woesearchaeota archaeon]
MATDKKVTYWKRGSMKAQITMFMILGIVILAAFGFVFYVNEIMSQIRLQHKVDQIMEDVLETTALDYYVTICLESATQEALAIASLQGGRIYETQIPGTKQFQGPPSLAYGSFVLPLNMSQTVFGENATLINVSYGIARPNLTVSQWHPDVPYYPYLQDSYTFLVEDPQAYDTRYKDTLGNFRRPEHILPALCDRYGMNALQSFNYSANGTNYTVWVRCRESWFDTVNTSDHSSIQEQLQFAIANKTRACVDFPTLSAYFGLNITEGNITSKILFSDAYVDSYLDYPLVFSVAGREPITKFLTFATRQNIRFMYVYDTAMQIIEADTNNVFFDMVTDAYSLTRGGKPYLQEGMTVFKEVQPCKRYDLCPQTGNYSDIYVIQDNNSLIDGRPLRFQFAIENRKPALNYITFSNYSGVYDLILRENETIVIDPYAYDPDEDFHSPLFLDLFNRTYMLDYYVYRGWKEDYDEWFDFSCCIPPIGSGSVNCTDDTLASQCVVRNLNAPQQWSTSSLFQQTSRSANYNLTLNDTGPHEVSVYVFDEENGSFDYQDITILVMDTAQARPNGSNEYDDIPDNYASIEDRYILDATRSLAVYSPTTWFMWFDEQEATYLYQGPEPLVTIPQGATILNMSSYPFTRPLPGIDTSPLNHTINLSVSSLGSPFHSAIMNVSVFYCLPHRTETASFPYHNLSLASYVGRNYSSLDDPFQANHACCSDDAVMYGSYTLGNSCFTYEEYGSHYSFNNDLFLASSLPVSPSTYTVTYYDLAGGQIAQGPITLPIMLLYPYDNDLYQRSFERSCDGTRGNVCQGAADEKRESIAECPDKLEPWYDERCSGPEEAYRNTASATPLACTQYITGKTFESIFQNGQGNCSHDRVCTTGSGAGKYHYNTPSGRFSCVGQCGSSGNCDYGTACYCDQSCGANSYCNQKQPGYRIGRCDQVGQVYFEDKCTNDCLLQDTTPVFKCTGSCSCTEPQCDGHVAGDALGVCNRAGTTWFEDQCTSNAGATDITTICKLNAATCDDNNVAVRGVRIADTFCNGQAPGAVFGSGSRLEQGCEFDCTGVSCTPYAFDPLTKTCHDRSTATGLQHCDDAFGWDPESNRCLSCTNNRESGGDARNLGTCEADAGEGNCNADSLCDELSPGNSCGTGMTCQTDCRCRSGAGK